MTLILFQPGATSWGFQFGRFWFYFPKVRFWRSWRPEWGVNIGWTKD